MLDNIDFTKLSTNLDLHSDGIWYAKSKNEISYPADGNNDAAKIEENSYWFNHRNKVFASLIKRFCKPEDIFYDVGGGNGFVTKGLENEGINAVLIEPGIGGVLNAKKRGVKNVICASTETCGIAKNTIDAIGVFDVVEHIEDDKKFLQQINDMLKPKGLIFMTVPAYEFLWCNEDDYAGHYRRYTTRRAKKVLNEAGFDILFSSYLFSVLPLPIFLIRSIPSRLGMHNKVDNVEKYKKEHNTSNSKGLLQKIWNWELDRIEHLRSIPFGSSVLMVGIKK